jgi:hypothetical protein
LSTSFEEEDLINALVFDDTEACMPDPIKQIICGLFSNDGGVNFKQDFVDT